MEHTGQQVLQRKLRQGRLPRLQELRQLSGGDVRQQVEQQEPALCGRAGQFEDHGAAHAVVRELQLACALRSAAVRLEHGAHLAAHALE